MTQEPPIQPKEDFGFPNPQQTFDDVKNELEQDTSKALVLTHPFKRFGANEEEISFMLQNQEQYDDVFYIGQSHGRTPVMVDVISDQDDINKRSRLPPGFEDGNYERGLHEIQWGEIDEIEAGTLLKQYDEIAVGGASRDSCVQNTMDSLENIRETSELYSSTELYVDDDFTYTESDRTRKVV